MPQNASDDKSILVQVMAWCRKAPNHYLSQCWPRSMSPWGITRPQQVKYDIFMIFCVSWNTENHLPWGRISITCNIGEWRGDMKSKFFIFFPKNNAAYKELTSAGSYLVINYTSADLFWSSWHCSKGVHILRHKQNGRHIAGDILKYIFCDRNIFLLKFQWCLFLRQGSNW